MKGNQPVTVRDAFCVLAALVCVLGLDGCEVQAYRPSPAQPVVPSSTVPAARARLAVAASAVRKPVPVQKAATQLAGTSHASAPAPGPTPRGAAWQPMPGAIYATAQPVPVAVSAAAPMPAPSIHSASEVARQPARVAQMVALQTAAPAPQPASPSASVPVGTPSAAQTPLPSPAPVPERGVHPAAAHAFGDAEAQAVRYAGGPCSAGIYRIAWAAADLFHIRPEFVAALIEIESGCRSDAVSVAGARGLMQLVPASGAREGYRFMHGTDRKVTLAELHDPATNIQLGVAYLGALQDHFGYIDGAMSRLILVVAAYNCGPDFLDQRLPPDATGWTTEQTARWVSRNAPQETRGFVEAVMRKAALYSSAALTARGATMVSSRSFSP